MAAQIEGGSDRVLASRVEDAGLNASAPPEQRWVDGWLVRYSPGKAQRARCINALSGGLRDWRAKLAECEALFLERRLPLIVRITPFTQPAELDAGLAELGFVYHDPTRVMVRSELGSADAWLSEPLPGDLVLEPASPEQFAQAVGALRGSSAEAIAAQAQRLGQLPVSVSAWLVRRRDDGAVLSCAQGTREGPLIGLYDVATAPAARGRGLATSLCRHLLHCGVEQGVRSAYLQVSADNETARRIYRRLGFADVYGYHYRVRPPE